MCRRALARRVKPLALAQWLKQMGTGIRPRFETLDGRSGLRVVDPIEDARFGLYTPERPSVEPADTGAFTFPVDAAVSVETASLRTPQLTDVWVRDADGDLVAEAGSTSSASLPPGRYELDLTNPLLKLYAVVDAPVSVSPGEGEIAVEFGEPTTVRIGARSFHDRPARTVTTTDDPGDLMRAVSCFGAAMATLSPERSFPNLRGHPPVLERGEELSVPDGLAPPDTGVRITLPAAREWVYPAATPAYYLGATVEPGAPALHLDGQQFPLGPTGGYDPADAADERAAVEQHLGELLQHAFLLDCVTRTEGYFDVRLAARERVTAAGVELPWAELYDATPAERLRAYLSVPFEDVADARPEWGLTADMAPDPDNATALPFLANDLATVRCPDGPLPREPPSQEAVDSFFRGAGGTGALHRGRSAPDRESVVSVPSRDGAVTHAWVGDGFPVDASKVTVASYLRQLQRSRAGRSRIGVDVVVNEAAMDAERDVSGSYGARDLFEFDVAVHESLDRSELARVFESDTDFVHYVGHVERQGFRCADGYLGVGSIGTVGAGAFFLNGCSSYSQGQRLVENGAIAGVVTLEDVLNDSATAVGRLTARLLNHGFPLQRAVALVSEVSLAGHQYSVVGDGTADLVSNAAGSPNVTYVRGYEDGTFTVDIEVYPTRHHGIGAMFTPYIGDNSMHYLNSGHVDRFAVGSGEIEEFLSLATFPLVAGDSLVWSDEVTVEELRSLVA